MQEEEQQVLGKLEQRRELSQELVHRVKKLQKNRGSFSVRISPMAPAGSESMAKRAPIFRNKNLHSTNHGGQREPRHRNRNGKETRLKSGKSSTTSALVGTLGGLLDRRYHSNCVEIPLKLVPSIAARQTRRLLAVASKLRTLGTSMLAHSGGPTMWTSNSAQHRSLYQ